MTISDERAAALLAKLRRYEDQVNSDDYFRWPESALKPPQMLVPLDDVRALLAAREELKSYKFMVAQVHRVCDEAGLPKPPENEPGVPWRVLRLLAEREAAGKVREAVTGKIGAWMSIQEALAYIATGEGDRGCFLTEWAKDYSARLNQVLKETEQ